MAISATSLVIFERRGAGVVEEDLGEVPPELKTYFEKNVVDPRLLATAACRTCKKSEILLKWSR